MHERERERGAFGLQPFFSVGTLFTRGFCISSLIFSSSNQAYCCNNHHAPQKEEHEEELYPRFFFFFFLNSYEACFKGEIVLLVRSPNHPSGGLSNQRKKTTLPTEFLRYGRRSTKNLFLLLPIRVTIFFSFRQIFFRPEKGVMIVVYSRFFLFPPLLYYTTPDALLFTLQREGI